MTRILHLIPGLGWGGAERQLVVNLSALDRERFESYVCYLYPRHDRLPPIQEMGIPVFCLGLWSGRLQWPIAVAKIRSLIKRLGIDIIHTSNYEADVIGGLAGKLAGVPVVSTLTNVGNEGERMVDNHHVNRLKLSLSFRLQAAMLKRAKLCIAISESVKDSVARTQGIPKRKVRVIYRALPEDWFDANAASHQSALRDELGIGDAYPVVLNVGRLVPQKGQRYLIEAVARCIVEFPEIRVLIAGKGYFFDSLSALRDDLGLQDNVVFLGTRNDVKDLLDLCDLFVFPSLYEGFGNAWLEAAARAKPCIASDVGPIREALSSGKNSVLVPAGDPYALADAICKLAREPEEARRLGQNAATMVSEKFRITQTIKQLEAVYEEAVGIPAALMGSK